MRKSFALVTMLAALGAVSLPAGAHNEGLPSVPLEIDGVQHVYNRPNASGNNLAFFEREQGDGTVRRYLVASTQGNGFDIYDVTDPAHVAVAGQYVLGGDPAVDPQGAVEGSSLGFNYHPWVDVNPEEELVVLSIENLAGGACAPPTVRHDVSCGVVFVDISDIANPRTLGRINGVAGPHTVRFVGDRCVYTSLNTRFIDYSDPMNPVEVDPLPVFEGHEWWEDPNIPNRTYVGTTQPGKWAIWDTTDCMNPQIVTEYTDRTQPFPSTVHEVYPSPDSSYVIVADFADGLFETSCPGGGVHLYDISGKYVPGASLTDPRDMGTYFAPFEGQLPTAAPNHASCTPHSIHMAPEREMMLVGLYAGGTYAVDPRATPGAAEHEDTTTGSTAGRIRDAADFVNAAQWLPFDNLAENDSYLYTAGWERGVDSYVLDGDLPAKMSRLRLDGGAQGGVVTGTLDRYAVLTHTGWENLPLAGMTVEVTAGGATVEATTGADGTFSADLGLAGGAHQVTVTWAGDETFRAETTTTTVVAA